MINFLCCCLSTSAWLLTSWNYSCCMKNRQCYAVTVCSTSVLILWSTSVLQYSLVLTSTKTRRPRLSLNPEGLKLQPRCLLSVRTVEYDSPMSSCRTPLSLALRLYCLIGLDIFSVYNLLFLYGKKNVLVILLQGVSIISINMSMQRSSGFS